MDEYFDTWIDEKMARRITRGKYGIGKLPPLSLILDVMDELDDVKRDDYEDGRDYEKSVDFLGEILSSADEDRSIDLLRRFRMESLEKLETAIDKGKRLGIYWSARAVRGGLPDEPAHGCAGRSKGYVVLSARFGVDCIDVMKTMIANMIWGIERESEVRLLKGCTGIAIHASSYDPDWRPVDEMWLDEKKVTA